MALVLLTPGAVLTGPTAVGALGGIPTLTTDLPDYSPEEVVTVSGTDLSPNTAYDVPVIRPDGTIVHGDGTFIPGWDTVTTDDVGGFTYAYTLDGIMGTYEVRAYPSPWSGDVNEVPAASVTFTDGTSRLEHCANGSINMPNQCTSAVVNGQWTQTALVSGNAHYYEGHSVPFRLRMQLITPVVSHTVTLEWNTTNATGKHAYDYLTSYDRTQHAAAPCAGITACIPTTFSTAAIPADPNIPAAVKQVAGLFTLYNGTITAVSGYTLSGSYTGLSKTSITLTFTSIKPTNATLVLAFAAHVAGHGGWGSGNNAIIETGTPYHLRLLKVDGATPSPAAGQDRPMTSDPTTGATLADVQPPACKLTKKTATGVEVTGQDLEGGLLAAPGEKGVVVTSSTNATTTLPTFLAADTALNTVVSNRTNTAMSASLGLKWVDTAGNITLCDPVWVPVVRQTGAPVTQTFLGIPAAEHLVTVFNGTPNGLTSLGIFVNGVDFEVTGLAPGGQRTLDVGSAMVAGSGNTVKLVARGKPGTSAAVLISDI